MTINCSPMPELEFVKFRDSYSCIEEQSVVNRLGTHMAAT